MQRLGPAGLGGDINVSTGIVTALDPILKSTNPNPVGGSRLAAAGTRLRIAVYLGPFLSPTKRVSERPASTNQTNDLQDYSADQSCM